MYIYLHCFSVKGLMMVGREQEKKMMMDLLASPKSEMLAIYGRRRIGKTYLVRKVYNEHLTFEFTGTQNATLKNQIFKFLEKIREQFTDVQTGSNIKSWQEVFVLLKKVLEKQQDKKIIIFFDELPWICGKNKKFLEELAYWWNDWAVNQNILVIICGSAASWMIKNVISHKGGLHNRVTKRINLQPFTLSETKLYLESNGIYWDDYQIIQFYMAVGGIPIYLNEAQKNETVTQTIDRIFFTKDGFMVREFNNLYSSLFDNYQFHEEVIKTLAGKWGGMTRQEILSKSNFKDGGWFTNILNELEASSFIQFLPSLNKNRKDFVYRLTDEYSLFYLQFLKNKLPTSKGKWIQQFNTQKYRTWCGYAFENICIKHVDAIKKSLGISGIYTEVSSYIKKQENDSEGFQIDLIIDRADNAMNLCEIKFYADDFKMTEEYSNQLRKRRELFREKTKTKKHLFNTLITTYGLKNSTISTGQIDQVITMDQLFVLQTFS